MSSVKITPPEGNDVMFRADLRPPKVAFGYCGLTGEWAPIVSVDLGDTPITVADETQGVEIGEDGQVKFTVYKPHLINSTLSVSRRGLEMLMNYMDSQDSPIPVIKPNLVYMWRVTFNDTTHVSQFDFDSVTGFEKENEFPIERLHEIAQISLISRDYDERTLPTYTYVHTTGEFFKAGVCIPYKELMYDGEFQPDSMPIHFRKVFGNQSAIIAGGLCQSIETAKVSVRYLLGWKIDGLQSNKLGCIIAVDERGHWMPYDYIERPKS